MVTLSRHQRTPQSLATYASKVVGAITGETAPSSQALSWASDALQMESFQTHRGTPFAGFPAIEVRYSAHFDSLDVRNKEIRNPSSAALKSRAANAGPDLGVGAEVARSKADGLLAAMRSVGAIADEPYVFGGLHRAKRTLHSKSTETSHSEVLDFTFVYHRSVERLSVINSDIKIAVHRDGQISRVRINDVQVSLTSDTKTKISDEEGFSVLESQALAALAPTEGNYEVALHEKQVGYFLPADESTNTVGPVAKAKITLIADGGVSRAHVGVVALTEESPDLKLLSSAPRPPAARRANGEHCTDDEQCVSSYCYRFGDLGGFCGSCGDDSDCALGCNHPKILSEPIVPSACGNGSLGAGCQDDNACNTEFSCAQVKVSASGVALLACSECSEDSDCSQNQSCAVAFSAQQQQAYRVCRDSNGWGLGQICDTDAQCGLGHCETYRFPDGTEVGVCGECKTDAECPLATQCVPSAFSREGFEHSRCE